MRFFCALSDYPDGLSGRFGKAAFRDIEHDIAGAVFLYGDKEEPMWHSNVEHAVMFEERLRDEMARKPAMRTTGRPMFPAFRKWWGRFLEQAGKGLTARGRRIQLGA